MLTEWLGLGEPPPISVRQEIYPLCSADIISSDLLPTNSNNFFQKTANKSVFSTSRARSRSLIESKKILVYASCLEKLRFDSILIDPFELSATARANSNGSWMNWV